MRHDHERTEDKYPVVNNFSINYDGLNKDDDVIKLQQNVRAKLAAARFYRDPKSRRAFEL